MKKITSLLLIAFFGLVVSASAAIVTLTNSSNYEVSIDNRVYTGNNTYTITDLGQGNHVISVYQVTSNGVFGIGKKRNLISTREFTLNNNDVRINVNQSGQLSVSQRNYNQNGTADNDDNWNNSNNDRKYGKSEGKGNGHKYGHYKNKKNKNNQDKYDRRDDDRRDDDRKYDNKQQNKNNKKAGKNKN